MTESKDSKIDALPDFSFLYKLDLDRDVIRRLTLHLSKIYLGDGKIFISPIGLENDPKSILDNVDKIFDKGKSLLSDNLINLEESNRSKYGPRSIAKSWLDRQDSLIDYFKHQDDYSNINIRTKFPNVNQYRPISLSNAVSALKSNTNSGLPYYTRKGRIKSTLESNFVTLLDRQDPCVLFTRTQEANKTRNVWGYPVADTLNEMRFYKPTLDYQKTLSWRSALLGPDIVDKKISNLMITGKAINYNFISIDFSAYDASVGHHLQKHCFDYIKSLFQPSFSDELDYVQYRFNNIGILTPISVINGRHGVPSGATFTNEVDSIAQYLIAHQNDFINDDLLQIQGDDGAYCIRAEDNESLFKTFKEAGLSVNESKSYTSDNHIVYLQRLYDLKYQKGNFIGGIYSIYRALNRIIYQERFSDFKDFDLDGRDYYSIRTISILENCKYHPLFKDFVNLIYKLDKYSLSFSKGAVDKYIKLTNQSQGTSGLLMNQFSDNVKGINNFETVKLIKELG